MRLAPSYVHSSSIPTIWHYRNESGSPVIHMDNGVERGLSMIMNEGGFKFLCASGLAYAQVVPFFSGGF